MRSEQASPPLNPEFVDALRVLFDILDTSRTGKVSYETLSTRFSELPKPHLPPTFLSCVGKVTPASGYLTFERFLTAVRLSLRDRDQNNNQAQLHRVQSEGKLNSPDRKQSRPAMGINGLNGMERRSYHGSQPAVNQSAYAPYADYASFGSFNTSPGSGGSPIYGHGMHMQPPSYAEYGVVMRQKKPNTPRSQKEESRMRHPQQPASQPVRVAAAGRRPHSTTSYNSLASSNLSNIQWRNSQVSSADSSKRDTVSEEEIAPRVAKLSSIHQEEDEMVKRGLDQAKKLIHWYEERLESIQKRQRLLGKGMVSLDSAVHEQKLNFLRAHVTELNRRMTQLVETSEKGFPSHVNLAKNAMPQPHDDQLVWLHRQNKQLTQELAERTRQLEDLRVSASQPGTRHGSTVHMAPILQQHPHMMQMPRPVGTPGGRAEPKRPTVISRPSAFVRPAVKQTRPISNSPPHKIYDTLM